MPKVDIAKETLAVGNALASVRIDQMILNLAKGIAWGQYELDKVGVDICKMMGVPGTVTIGDDSISLLEAGFIPSFYHFVDTILELKIEVNIREEEATSLAASATTSGSLEVTTGIELKGKHTIPSAIGVTEISAKAHWETTAKSAYARSMDAKHSQTFSQDLSASSLMRTKLVPIPAPDLLVERIKILIERLRAEAEEGYDPNDATEERSFDEILLDSVTKRLLGRVEEAAGSEETAESTETTESAGT